MKKPSPNILRLSMLAAFLCGLLADAPKAGCGLTFCPKPEGPGERSLDLSFMVKNTGFDIQGVEGSYTELMVTVQYTAFGRLALGLHSPFLFLETDGSEAGMGNLVAYGEWRLRPAFLAALALGVQLEIPMGGSDHGLGDDHWMAVPYLTAAKHAGPLMLGAALGTAFTVYGGHSDAPHHTGQAPTPVYVHPHEHFELLYRFSAGARLLDGAFLPEAFLDGQQVLGHSEVEGADIAFLATGVSLPWIFGAWQVVPSLSLPVLSRDRFLWNAGITLGWKLGFGASTPRSGET